MKAETPQALGAQMDYQEIKRYFHRTRNQASNRAYAKAVHRRSNRRHGKAAARTQEGW